MLGEGSEAHGLRTGSVESVAGGQQGAGQAVAELQAGTRDHPEWEGSLLLLGMHPGQPHWLLTGCAGEGLTSGRWGTGLKDCVPSSRREEQGHRCFHPGLCGREMAPAVHPTAERAESCQMSSHSSLPLPTSLCAYHCDDLFC